MEPGETGTLTFTFSPTALYGTNGLISSPTINAEISIKGRQPSEGNVFKEINSIERKTLKINSDLQLVAKALHSSGPITNTGPIPPKAEQSTTYTIVWTATNTSNAVTGAEVRATIPQYVKYTGNTSSVEENLSYNDQSREVVWNLGSVSSGAGLSGGEREVAFQLELTPSISQVGSIPQLTSEAVIKGNDTFSGGALKSTWTALSTRLLNDANFRSGDERVAE